MAIGVDFIDVGWGKSYHASLEVGYFIYFADGTFIGDAGANQSYRVTGLTPDTEYSFYIKSYVTYPPLLGEELVTNGGFFIDANWTKGVGWNIVTGDNGHANNDGQVGGIGQSVLIVGGSTYFLSFETDAAAYQGLGLKYRVGSAAFSGAVSGDGLHSFEQVAGVDDSLLSFSSDATNDFLGNLRNISLKKLLRSETLVRSEASESTTVSTKALP